MCFKSQYPGLLSTVDEVIHEIFIIPVCKIMNSMFHFVNKGFENPIFMKSRIIEKKNNA